MANAYLKPNSLKIGKNKTGNFSAALLPNNNSNNNSISSSIAPTNHVADDSDALFNQLTMTDVTHDSETINSIITHLRGNQTRNLQIINSLKQHVNQLTEQLNVTREEAKQTIEKMWNSQKQSTSTEHNYRLLEDELRQLRLFKKDSNLQAQEERDVHQRILEDVRAQLNDKDMLLKSDMTMRNRLLVESNETEKKQFQTKLNQATQALSIQEQSTLESSAESHNLAQNVLRLSQENVSLNEQLRVQEEKISEVISAFTMREKDLINLREENQNLKQHVDELNDANTQASNDASKSSEQLRQMAEKVFSLLGQIQKMEQWKMTALEEQRNLTQKLTIMNQQYDEMQNNFANENRAKVKIDKDYQNNLKILEEHRLALADLKRKATTDERQQRQLTITLKKRTEDFEASQTKSAQVAIQLRTSQQQLETAKRNLFVAEEKVKASAGVITQNTARIESLSAAVSKANSTIASLNEELKNSRDNYSKSQQNLSKIKEQKEIAPKAVPVKAAVESRSSTVPRSRPARGAEETSTLSRTWFKTLINGPDGEIVKKLMKSLNLDENRLTTMITKQPNLFLVKVATYYQDIFVQQAMLEAEQSTCFQAYTYFLLFSLILRLEKLGISTYKNSDLLLSLQTSEHGRTASLNQLLSILLQVHHAVTNMITENIDSPDDVEKFATVPLSIMNELMWLIQTLNLSNHGITDDNLDILSIPFSRFSMLHHVNMQRNLIGDKGFIEIAKLLMNSDCSISSINLSMNQIDIGGLKGLSDYLKSNSNVVQAGFRPIFEGNNTTSDWVNDWMNVDKMVFLPKTIENEVDEQIVAGGVRPIVQIILKNKKISINISANKFDDRLLTRIGDLVRADFDDPEFLRLIDLNNQLTSSTISSPTATIAGRSPGFTNTRTPSNPRAINTYGKTPTPVRAAPIRSLGQSQSEANLRPKREDSNPNRKNAWDEPKYDNRRSISDDRSNNLRQDKAERESAPPKKQPATFNSAYMKNSTDKATNLRSPYSFSSSPSNKEISRPREQERDKSVERIKKPLGGSASASTLSAYMTSPVNKEKPKAEKNPFMENKPARSNSSYGSSPYKSNPYVEKSLKSPYAEKAERASNPYLAKAEKSNPYLEKTLEKSRSNPYLEKALNKSSSSKQLNPYLQDYANKQPSRTEVVVSINSGNNDVQVRTTQFNHSFAPPSSSLESPNDYAPGT